MKTINKKVKDLKPYKNNARQNSLTVDKLTKSITEYGYVVPIVIDTKNVVVTGHARLKAIIELGWVDVPCVVSELTDDQNKEYRIIDNKVAEISTFDDEMLILELRALQDIAQEFDFKINNALESSYGNFDNNVTEEDIEKTEGKFETVFADRVNKATESIIDVECEHCGTTFGINENDL